MTNNKTANTTFERIKHEPGVEDGWVCLCGNTPADVGFYPCDKNGNEIEPDIESEWDDLYLCFQCGRIIDQKTLSVIGRSPNAQPLAS